MTDFGTPDKKQHNYNQENVKWFSNSILYIHKRIYFVVNVMISNKLCYWP
jgi:hypothetical protein